jgi:hypothetical protein
MEEINLNIYEDLVYDKNGLLHQWEKEGNGGR